MELCYDYDPYARKDYSYINSDSDSDSDRIYSTSIDTQKTGTYNSFW